MEQAILKAIEGGWQPQDVTWGESQDLGEMKYAEMVIDPLFWQALGKSCGWKETRWKDTVSDKILLRRYEKKGGLYHALTFHEINLTQSWDAAIEYLTSIIT